MELWQMKRSKYQKFLTCEEIAKGSGVPLSTVRKIFCDQTKRPRRQTVERLSVYFESLFPDVQVDFYHDEARRHESIYNMKSGKKSLSIRQESAYLKDKHDEKKEYTYEDYQKLPEDFRVELIDGQFVPKYGYDKDGKMIFAPSVDHQRYVTELLFQVKTFIKNNNGKCIPFVAPTDVRLNPNDNKNYVQPDFFVICDENKLENGAYVVGAPDWVVEVLSPSNRDYDMFEKRDKYKDSGVREYWVVDIEREYVIIYPFEKSDMAMIRSMHEPIPVGIYDEELKVDLTVFRVEF